MRFTPLVAAGALLLAAVGTAQAQNAGRALAALDTNGDGALQLPEIEAASAARFARLDANGDGMVSAAEFNLPLQRAFAAIDGNGDGALTQKEIRSKANEARALFGAPAR